MKTNYRFFTLLLFCMVFGLSSSLWAQKSELELPDLTTVVTSEQKDIEEIAVPDFSDVVTLPDSSGYLVPQLPEVEVLEKSDVVVTDPSVSNKQVFAEGQAGGGFPATFLGKFSVSRITGNEPFLIGFSHVSEAGYAGKELSAGYSFTNTVVNLDKVFAWQDFNLDVAGYYENIGNGFQSQIPDVFAQNQNYLSGIGTFNWALPYDFNIGAKLDLGYYYRYTDLTPDATCENYQKHTGVININPSLYGNWSNENLFFQLNGSVFIDGDLQKAFTVGRQYGSRTSLDVTGLWKYDTLKVFGGAGLIFGDNLNSNKIIAPFNIGLTTSFPVYFSDRNTVVLVEGGLETTRNTNQLLEKQYKFAALNVIPSETSDWFTNINFSVPLKTSFTGELGFTYKKTAFGNGFWEPDYKNTAEIYTYNQNEKTIFATDLAVTYRRDIFAGTLKWHANWKDAPVLENKQTFFLDLSFQDPEVKWGVNLNTGLSLDAKDKIPVVNMEGFVGISPQVKLVLTAEDILKLIDPQPRTYAGKFITDSGNIKLLVKFLY